MRHSLSRLVFLLTVVSISGSAQHVVAGPSEAIRLEMFFERAVVEDKDLFLDCGVVFFGKSSSLVRMPQHCVVEFSEMPSREVDKSGKSEVWIPGLPLDSSGLLGGPIGDQETFVVVKHSRDNKKFLRENYCSFRVRLCSVSDLEKRFRDAIATVTVELGTREFPLDPPVSTEEHFYTGFEGREVKLEVETMRLQKLRQEKGTSLRPEKRTPITAVEGVEDEKVKRSKRKR